jgi:hypothetical protein
MEFFRHCPGCGRRFHIKLVSKKLVHMDREPVPTTNVDPIGGGTGFFMQPRCLTSLFVKDYR